MLGLLFKLIDQIKILGIQFTQKSISIYEYQNRMQTLYAQMLSTAFQLEKDLRNQITYAEEGAYNRGLKKCQSTATMPTYRAITPLSDKSMFPLSDEQKALYDIVESVRTIKRNVNDATRNGVEYVPLTSINGVVDAVGDYATDVLLESKNSYLDSLNNIGNTLNPFSF